MWRSIPTAVSRNAGLLAVTACSVVAASLLLPFILWQNAWIEWGNALWLIEHQAESIRNLGHPSYFLHTADTGAFYPQFLYYGGSLFAVAGVLSVILGSSWAAFVALLLAASAAAFGGMLWLGRQAGLSLGVASMPALVMITSPYAISNLYGRGAFAEIVAVSFIPLALAGLFSIARGEHVWRGVSAGAVSVAAVAGSHNITLVWGSLICAAVVAIVAWATGRGGRRAIFSRRALVACGAVVLGVALVAWALIPAAVYGPETRAYADTRGFLAALPQLDRLDVIFSPILYAPPSIAGVNPTNYYQVPVYVMAWTLVVIAVAVVRGRARQVDRRLAAGLLALSIVLVVLLVASLPWDYMPGILATIQFPLRLHGYVIIVAALLAIVALRTLGDGRRRSIWLATLAAALLVQTAFVEDAAWRSPTFYDRHVFTSEARPPSFATYQTQMYILAKGALAHPPMSELAPSVVSLSDDRLVLEGLGGRSGSYRTNIVASDAVRIRPPWGVVGHDARGFLVLSAPATGSAQVVAEPATPWPVALGISLSLAALMVAVIGGLVLLGRRGREALSGRARRA